MRILLDFLTDDGSGSNRHDEREAFEALRPKSRKPRRDHASLLPPPSLLIIRRAPLLRGPVTTRALKNIANNFI